MSESHIDFKEFDNRRNLEVERLYGEMQRQRGIALEALEYIAGDDDDRCREANCGCRPCIARKALTEIKKLRGFPA